MVSQNGSNPAPGFYEAKLAEVIADFMSKNPKNEVIPWMSSCRPIPSFDKINLAEIITSFASEKPIDNAPPWVAPLMLAQRLSDYMDFNDEDVYLSEAHDVARWTRLVTHRALAITGQTTWPTVGPLPSEGDADAWIWCCLVECVNLVDSKKTLETEPHGPTLEDRLSALLLTLVRKLREPGHLGYREDGFVRFFLALREVMDSRPLDETEWNTMDELKDMPF